MKRRVNERIGWIQVSEHAILRYVSLSHGFENPHNSLRPSAWGDLIPSDVQFL